MKNIKLLSVMALVCNSSFCQEFSFSMFFEDAVGNKDTLVFGYDDSGTDTIDSVFGEINISGEPLDENFDVRISNYWTKINLPYTVIEQPYIQTKIQIIGDSCSGMWFPFQTIDIKCKNWPVTATWDNSIFNFDCVEGSVFTSFHPGGWWDVNGFPSDLNRIVLSEVNQIIFTSNYNGIDFDENYAYVNEFGDTIPVFWQAFGDSSLLNVSVREINREINIYPNPANDLISINLGNITIIDEVSLFDLNGIRVLHKQNFSDKRLDISAIPDGIYLLKIFSKSNYQSKKIVVLH